MTPTDCPTAAKLAAFHTGQLAVEHIAVLAGHLDSCARCRSVPVPSGLPLADNRLTPARFDAEAGCLRARKRVAGITGTGPAAGQVLGDFQLIDEIGRGGMGVVYEAEQMSLGRRVAVKVLHTRSAGDRHLMRRFEREAKAVGRLHHTNVVPVFGVGEHDGSPYYAMQLVHGVGLNELVDTPSSSEARPEVRDSRWAAGLIAQAADGIAHAHDQGVLHRDVKPSNLLLDTLGTVWVTDFGLAKTDDAADLTHTGDLLGTVRYMAPEAFDGKADGRADVYALGLTLYELLAGRPAFDGTDRGQVIRAVLEGTPPPLGRIAPGLPRDLLTIVAKAIDRDPARRYQTAHALADDLRRFVRDEPILARRIGPVERLGRWARHNRGLAGSLAGLAVTLVCVTVGALIAADRFRGMAKEQSELAASEATQRRLAQEVGDEARASQYAAEMGVAARLAEQPTGLARLRELVARWDDPPPDRPDPRGWEWRLFRRLARPERWVRSGREWAYTAVAFSPDGRRLAVGVAEAVELLDPADGTVLARFPLPGKVPASLRWGADGRRLAVGQGDGRVTTLDATTGAAVYRATHGRSAAIVCLHPGGDLLASHADDGVVRVYDLVTGKEVAALTGAYPNVPSEFGFSPDGRRLATYHTGSVANQRVVAVWDTADWRRVGTVVGPAGDVIISVGWAGADYLMLTLDKSGAVVWDVATDTAVRPLAGTAGHLMVSQDVAAGGRWVAAGDWGRVVWVWDATTGKAVAVCRGHTERLYRVALAPDGRRVAGVAMEGAASALRVWDVGGRQPVRTFDPPSAGTIWENVGLAWHPSGSRLAGTVPGRGVGVHDLDGTPTVFRPVQQLAWDRAGRRAAATIGDELRVYEGDGPDPARTHRLPGGMKSFAWHPTDDRLAIRVGLHLWVCDPNRPDPPTRVYDDQSFFGRVPYYPCGGVAWHPDGRTLAFTTRDDDGWSIRLLDPSTGATTATFPAMPLTVWAVRWSPDGKRLAVAGDDPAVKVFDPATGAVVHSLTGHTFTVRDLAYSPDGTRLASAGLDGNVMLWNPASGRLLLTFELGSPVLGVAWSRDGAKLAAMTETGVVKVWDAGDSSPGS